MGKVEKSTVFSFVWRCGLSDGGSGLAPLESLKDGVGRILKCVAGTHGAVLLTDNGDLFSLYGGEREAKRLELPERITDVSAGYQHFMALSEGGSVYAWYAPGAEEVYKRGQLGLGKDRESVYFPTIVDGISDVEEIVCGETYSLARTRDGKLYGWGYNRYYQCGSAVDDNRNLFAPTIAALLGGAKILKFFSGTRSGTTWVLIETKKGVPELLVIGYNYYGQCGLGIIQQDLGKNFVRGSIEQRQESIRTIKKIETSWTGVTYVLFEDGDLYSSGVGIFNGREDGSLYFERVEVEEKIVDMCGGSSSFKFISESGNLYFVGSEQDMSSLVPESFEYEPANERCRHFYLVTRGTEELKKSVMNGTTLKIHSDGEGIEFVIILDNRR